MIRLYYYIILLIQYKVRILNKKYKIKTHLKKGLNLFILHAESLGNQPPNTAAVSIKDGRIKRGDLVLFIGTGAGLSAASLLIRY